MARERHWDITLAGQWRNLASELDVDLMRRWVAPGTIAFADYPTPGSKEVSSWWSRVCAQRYLLDAIRDGMRPSEAHKAEGARTVAMLKDMGAQHVVAIHNRAFEGTGHCMRRALTADTYCHVSSNDRGDPNVYCPYRINDNLKSMLAADAPAALRDGGVIGWYMSTDGLVGDVPESLTDKAPYLSSLQRKTAMLADMWTWTLADYLFANPQSSCSPFVSSWRAAQGKPLSMYPRACYNGYSAARPDPVCPAEWGAKELREGCACD